MEERLTHTILFDIFSSKLPMKSLLRLRCASPSLRNMIDDPCFVTSHLIRAYPKESGRILLINGSIISLSLLTEDDRRDLKTSLLMKFPRYLYGSFDLYNSCNGLLCFFSSCKDSVVVLNPLTVRKETLILPESSMLENYFYRYLSFGLGHDTSTNTYKVIRLYFLSKELTEDMKYYNVEIYTLGTSSWRTISARPPCPHFGKPIFAYGALHWKPLTSRKYKMKGMLLTSRKYKMEDMLVSFDMADEVFYLTPHPGFKNFHLVEIGGSLGLVDLSSENGIEIWLLKNCCGTEKKEREWVKEYKIDINAPIEVIRKLEVVGMWENGEILLQSDRCLISYNPKTDELRHLFELDGRTNAYVYRESLVSLASFK